LARAWTYQLPASPWLSEPFSVKLFCPGKGLEVPSASLYVVCFSLRNVLLMFPPPFSETYRYSPLIAWPVFEYQS
jgi:hypothetical protein